MLITRESPVKIRFMEGYGTLFVVATPIGNLEDITLRAIRVLKEVDLIAAEDTRHTRKLLNHYNISAPLTSYFEHNKAEKGDYIIKNLREGKDVALVSDAGTPGISDPGYNLIKKAIDSGIKIVPVPGASALIAAISISGLTADSFAFEGFLPHKEKARKDKLESLKREERTLIFYESPQRLISTLHAVHDTIGNRNCFIARELTKIHEEALRGKVSDILAAINGQTVKGEVVIIIEGFHGEPFKGSISDELDRAVKSGLSVKEAIEAVARGLGISKGKVYKESLKLKKGTVPIYDN